MPIDEEVRSVLPVGPLQSVLGILSEVRSGRIKADLKYDWKSFDELCKMIPKLFQTFRRCRSVGWYISYDLSEAFRIINGEFCDYFVKHHL